MIKKLVMIIVVLTACCRIEAQNMRELFVAMPDSLSPLLTKVNRQDFGDFLDSKMKAVVSNRLSASTEMKTLTDDYLELQLSGSNEIRMRLLSVNDSIRVICVVSTYFGPVPDSDVKFYDLQWHPIPVSTYFKMPAESDFFVHADDDRVKQLLARSDMYLKRVVLSPTAQELTVTYTSPEFALQEYAEQIKRYLKPSIVYEWKNGQFQQRPS